MVTERNPLPENFSPDDGFHFPHFRRKIGTVAVAPVPLPLVSVLNHGDGVSLSARKILSDGDVEFGFPL